jgi:hypothetical protein
MQAASTVSAVGTLGADGAYAWGLGGNFVRLTIDRGVHWSETDFPGGLDNVTLDGRTLHARAFGPTTPSGALETFRYAGRQISRAVAHGDARIKGHGSECRREASAGTRRRCRRRGRRRRCRWRRSGCSRRAGLGCGRRRCGGGGLSRLRRAGSAAPRQENASRHHGERTSSPASPGCAANGLHERGASSVSVRPTSCRWAMVPRYSSDAWAGLAGSQQMTACLVRPAYDRPFPGQARGGRSRAR